MGRGRMLLVAASVTLAAATTGLLSAAIPAGATLESPTELAACGTVPAGHSTCLVRVFHRGGANAQTSPQGSSPTGYSPSTIEKAYGFASSDAGTGTGKTIAIVDAYDDPTIASNLATFSAEFGLGACATTNGCFTKVNQSGGTTYPRATAGWDVEISLDVEWAHAIAPKAHILLVEATSTSDTNLFDAVSYAAGHAQYVSMSWGGTEFAGETTFDSDFTSTDSFFAAAGDTGSEVIYPSSSPRVVSVGGTTLSVTTTGAWSAESAWSTGGGGCSTYETASAAQAAFPTYDQSGASCAGKRATPDVALDANPNTGVSIYDSVATASFGSGWEVVGGTSVATPIWAAHSAAAGDHVNATLVYGANLKFYDITSGTNGHTCVKGYNLCDGLGSWNTAVGTLNASPGASGAISFTQNTVSVKAGTPAELSVSLSSDQTGTVAVSLASTSSAGEFSNTATGTFSKTLTVTFPAGTTTEDLYYKDTLAGAPSLSASSSGWTSGTRSVTVTAGTLAKLTVSPTKASLAQKATQRFTATGSDAYGNAVPVDPTWTTTGTIGTITPSTGTTTAFTAGTTSGTGALTATQGGVSAEASVTVTTAGTSPTLSIASAPSVVPVGTQLDATAVTATLANGNTPSGTITFRVFGPSSAPSSCTSGGATWSDDTAAVSGDGTYHPTTGFTPLTTGTYWWYATYSGSTSNDATTSLCDSSSMLHTKANAAYSGTFTVAITGSSSQSASSGSSVTLSETGLPGANGGTVTFTTTVTRSPRSLCTISVSPTATTCRYAVALGVGTHTITANWTGGTDYLPATPTDTVTLTVLPSSGGDGGGGGGAGGGGGGGGGGGPSAPSTPTAPKAPTGATSHQSCSSASGPCKTTDDTVTASSNGAGAITVSQYSSDPAGKAGFAPSNEYFDVALSSTSTFTTVTVKDCSLNGGASFHWWNGATWQTVSPVTGPSGTPQCLSAALSATSSPSLSQLTGTVFAVGAEQATRVAGATADATAAAEFERAFAYGKGTCPSIRAAVLATTKTFQDALSSQFLAEWLTTGTLLTPTAGLSPVDATALEDEGISTVYVVGGKLAVSTAVVAAIDQLPADACGGTDPSGKISVVRIAGQSAYGTAEAVAEKVGVAASLSFTGAYGRYNDTTATGSAPPQSPEPTAILASGEEFQDAQAASVIAYRTKIPLLLTEATTLSTTAVGAIEKLGIKQVILLGGALAVSNAVEQELVQKTGVAVLRIAGEDPTDTAAALARFEVAASTSGLDWTTGHRAMVARSNGFTDGLAGAVLENAHNTTTGGAGTARPLLLAEGPTVVGSYLTTFLKLTGHGGIDGSSTRAITSLTVLGGPLAVSTAELFAMEADLKV